MKKLMIALAAVAMATGVQAASMLWQFTSSVTTADKWAGYDVYLFDTATFNAGKAASGAITADLLDSALDSSALYYGSGSGSSQLYKTGISGAVAERQVDGLAGASQDWTMILVNPDETSYQLLASGTTATYDPQSQSATKATKTITMANIVKITPNEVTGAPEPTSAMLLLLGVAGLALRRKQK